MKQIMLKALPCVSKLQPADSSAHKPSGNMSFLMRDSTKAYTACNFCVSELESVLHARGCLTGQEQVRTG